MTSPSGDPIADSLGYDDIIKQYLAQWGLSSLTDLVSSLGQSGASNDSISLQIQNSPQYQQRFAGNKARTAAGLSVLSPAEYIALEGQYKQTLSSYGIPAGFYDDQDAINNWIGGDVSASEVADRAKIASDSYLNASDSQKAAWDQYYGGHGAGGAIASILDTSTAEPILEQQATAAGIGAGAMDQGLSVNRSRAEELAKNGVTIDSARAAYSQIAGRLTNDNAIAARFGGTNSQTNEENITLLGNAAATKTQQTQYASEAAQFAGHGGASNTSNDVGNNF